MLSFIQDSGLCHGKRMKQLVEDKRGKEGRCSGCRTTIEFFFLVKLSIEGKQPVF